MRGGRRPPSRTGRSSERSTRPGAYGEAACRRRSCGTSSARRRLAPASTSWRRTISDEPVPVSATLRAANSTRSSSCSVTFHPDDGSLPRMQAEAPSCRERPVGHRTRRRLASTAARVDGSVRPARLLAANLTGGAVRFLLAHDVYQALRMRYQPASQALRASVAKVESRAGLGASASSGHRLPHGSTRSTASASGNFAQAGRVDTS